MNKLTVIVWRSGKLQCVRNAARYSGAIALVRGNARRVRTVCQCLARWAHDNKTMLCPGVPEADDDRAALRAISTFRDLLKVHLS